MRTRSRANALTIAAIDHDALRTVFKHLSAADLQAALRSCKQWSALATDDALWRGRTLNEWPGLLAMNAPVSKWAWKERYMSLWRAENAAPPDEGEDEALTLAALNEAYEFVVHVKDAAGQLIATGTAPVELTDVEAYAGPVMGGNGANCGDGVQICANFPTAFSLPSGLFDYMRPAEPMDDLVRLDMHVHVARKADGKVAHFFSASLTRHCNLDECVNGSYVGGLDAIGVGSAFPHWRQLRRALPSWLPLMKHALPEFPEGGTMDVECMGGEMFVESVRDDGTPEDDIGRIESIKLAIGKTACFGQDPFAPCFRTSLTLPDMPGILASKHMHWV